VRTAVTGIKGQVAVSWFEVGALSGVEVVAVGRPRLNLMALEMVQDPPAEAKPDVVVSTASCTAVDHVETAHAVNLSIDYVLSGAARRPYVESAPRPSRTS
jgi:dTDP-4-dehydrorhamnose reductase